MCLRYIVNFCYPINYMGIFCFFGGVRFMESGCPNSGFFYFFYFIYLFIFFLKHEMNKYKVKNKIKQNKIEFY